MSPASGWKITWPWALFGLQAVCVFFLVFEEVVDRAVGEQHGGLVGIDFLENLVVTVLVLGLVASGLQIRRSLTQQRRMEQQIKAASGAFANLLEEHFEAWGLTPSESDVALLALKGCSISEIADVRKTAEGTVKAQCNAIYRKAGVTGRPQLLSLFIDELFDGTLVKNGAEKAEPAV